MKSMKSKKIDFNKILSKTSYLLNKYSRNLEGGSSRILSVEMIFTFGY